MKLKFQGWDSVVKDLLGYAQALEQQSLEHGEEAVHLNRGQRASLRAIAKRIPKNGIVLADEVGMGKTRIAVALARAVVNKGGRVAILIPPGLGYQWHRELKDGQIPDAPPILRSLQAYLKAWEGDSPKPWFKESVVMISHAFVNWRLSEASDAWRWALMPELYAQWRSKVNGRLPNGYYEKLASLNRGMCDRAARDICQAIPEKDSHPVCRYLNELLDEIHWPGPVNDTAEYRSGGELRPWLERSVGLGLGVFDLVIVDEAHKSRDYKSVLSRLIDGVVVASDSARRLALTATPVELNVSQWENTLGRLGLSSDELRKVKRAAEEYANALKRVRGGVWRISAEAREEFKAAAKLFQETLSPYLLRRDKREDPDIQTFNRYSHLQQINAYRKESEVSINTTDLTMPWKRAICAAESLSIAIRSAEDPAAKRLRLTLANGHGISVILDQVKREEADRQQEMFDESIAEQTNLAEVPDSDIKRRERVAWWMKSIQSAYQQDENSLYDHPAILQAVKAIEEQTQSGEKVLVFGRFTRPLRALVDLLNAREMLRRIESGAPWPQRKVHEDGSDSELQTVLAAHRQLKSSVSLDELNVRLQRQYDGRNREREKFRDELIRKIEQDWEQNPPAIRWHSIFQEFKRSVDSERDGAKEEQTPLMLIARAMMELREGSSDDDSDYAGTFVRLLEAVYDNDDIDEADQELNEDEAAQTREMIVQRLREEYSRTQGGFARLMYGGTSTQSRRMIQLAFNRAGSFPYVLVAQSMVGREGLNLHKACRIVVLLHPEWNPGVVEQQIGRVDRVDSHWCKKLRDAIQSQKSPHELPRIEVRPVIFRGTYDEYNWSVLNERWDNLRSQLHGIVIPQNREDISSDDLPYFDEVTMAAPDFTPTICDRSAETVPGRDIPAL